MPPSTPWRSLSRKRPQCLARRCLARRWRPARSTGQQTFLARGGPRSTRSRNCPHRGSPLAHRPPAPPARSRARALPPRASPPPPAGPAASRSRLARLTMASLRGTPVWARVLPYRRRPPVGPAALPIRLGARLPVPSVRPARRATRRTASPPHPGGYRLVTAAGPSSPSPGPYPAGSIAAHPTALRRRGKRAAAPRQCARRVGMLSTAAGACPAPDRGREVSALPGAVSSHRHGRGSTARARR